MPERTKPPFRADHVGSLIRPDALIARARGGGEGRDFRRRAQAHPARRHPRRGAAAGGPWAQGRHRRRIQPPFLAPRLHAQVRQREARPVEDEGAVPYRGGRPRSQRRRRSKSRASSHARRRRHFRRRLQVPGLDRARDAEDHHPLADRHAFPRRTRGDRRQGLSGIGAFYDDLARLYREEIPILRRPAAATCRSTRSTSPICAIPNCAGRSANIGEDPATLPKTYAKLLNDTDRGPPSRHDGLHASLPRQFRRRLGGGRRLRADRRASVQRDQGRRLFSRIRSARAPAASRRCGSCPRARWRCSAWSRPRARRWRRRTSSSAASRRRAVRAARAACAVPQCGFSSGIGGNTMDVAREVAKLRLVVETAREVWGDA